jgi:hypothetical protein
VIEDPALAGVVLPGDVGGCLLVEPPWRQAQVPGYLPGLVQDDAVRHEPCIDVAGHVRAEPADVDREVIEPVAARRGSGLVDQGDGHPVIGVDAPAVFSTLTSSAKTLKAGA